MTNSVYGKGREKIMDCAIHMVNDDIKVALVDSAVYTVSIDTDEFLDDIASVVSTSTNLLGKANTLGSFSASPITLLSVSGAESEALVMYKDTGVPATSPLIAYMDQATGLPITPIDGDILITWPTFIFTL